MVKSNPINRKFYSAAILFAVLYLVQTLWSTLLRWESLGRTEELGARDLEWFWISILISFVYLFIALKYFHYKKYKTVFWIQVAIVLIFIVELSQFTLSFYSGSFQLSNFRVFLRIAANIVSIFLGLALTLSSSGTRKWLKLMGIFTIGFGLISSIFWIWAYNSLTAMLDGSAEIMRFLTGMISIIPLTFLILNFMQEKKETKATEYSQNKEPQLAGTLYVLGLIGIIATLFFAGRYTSVVLKLPDTTAYKAHQLKLARSFKVKTYTNAQGESLQYRLLVPENSDTTERYPLVISLHGPSGRGNDNVKQISRSPMAQLLSTQENKEKYPAYILVPQSPLNMHFGGISDKSAIDDLVIELIGELEQEYSIDPNRRYVVGQSLGAYGAWHLISSKPDLFAAAIPIAGAGDPAFGKSIADVPVWAFHGAKNRIVLPRGSRDMIKAMEDAGGTPKYTEYADMGYFITPRVTETPELLGWLFAQSR